MNPNDPAGWPFVFAIVGMVLTFVGVMAWLAFSGPGRRKRNGNGSS